MSRASSKPISVISVPDSPPPQASTHISDVNAKAPVQSKTVFSHVSIPTLSAEGKSQYKPPQSSSAPLLPKVDEVIGECTHDGTHWYFARYKGGIASRVRFLSFSASFMNFNAFFFGS
jgi:hypothetical protein